MCTSREKNHTHVDLKIQVLGYRHDFDIEGDSGVVSRGYGTACRIKERAEDDDKPIVTLDASIERRIRRSGVMLLTLEQIPPSKHITSKLGGVVGARSVKYLGKLKSTDADTETRDKWWAELREEIRANARALKCDFIVGYTEDATIRDDVCILSVQGTALSMIPEAGMYADRSLTTMRSSSSFHRNLFTPLSSRSTSAPVSSLPQHVPSLVSSKSATTKSSPSTPSSYSNINISTSPCQFCHVPCSENDAPFANMKLVRCGVCSNGWVPEILLATIEPPTNLPMLGRGHLVEARLCRQWRKTMGGELREEHASQVSRDLPFVEYVTYIYIHSKPNPTQNIQIRTAPTAHVETESSRFQCGILLHLTNSHRSKHFGVCVESYSTSFAESTRCTDVKNSQRSTQRRSEYRSPISFSSSSYADIHSSSTQ